MTSTDGVRRSPASARHSKWNVDRCTDAACGADKGYIELAIRPPFSAIRSASARKRLWLGAAGVALFLASLFVGNLLLRGGLERPKAVGLDFIAFYTAGTFVADGHADRMYDLNQVRAFQHDLAARYGVDIGQACGPWWNPPFYALVFVPLARLPYPAALTVWLGVNLACAAMAMWLMVRMLPKTTGWRTWALVPVLVILSTPFIHALSHAQNTCTSLLLLASAVALWRSERAFFAGLVGGLLFYKPQLAAIVAAVMVFDLGWRAAAGFAVTGAALLVVTLVALPGSLGEFVHRVPQNLDLVQSHTVYLWERHATFKAFWRLLLQGRTAGQTAVTVQALTLASMSALGIALAAAAVRVRSRSRESRDRLIIAAIVASPLLMPFYFDYDQLLLSIAAVLFVGELMACRSRASLVQTPSLPSPEVPGEGTNHASRTGVAPSVPTLTRYTEFVPRPDKSLSRRDRWLLVLWPSYYVWLMLNPDVAQRTHVSLTVPLLAAIASLMIARVAERAKHAIVIASGPVGPAPRLAA